MMAEFGKRSKVTLIQALSFIFRFEKLLPAPLRIQLSKLTSAKKKMGRTLDLHGKKANGLPLLFGKRNFKPFPGSLDFLYKNCEN